MGDPTDSPSSRTTRSGLALEASLGVTTASRPEADVQRRQLADFYAADLALLHADASVRLERPVLLLVEQSDVLGRAFLSHYFGRKSKLPLETEFQFFARELSELCEWFDSAGRLDYLTSALAAGADAEAVRILVIAFGGVTGCQVEL